MSDILKRLDEVINEEKPQIDDDAIDTLMDIMVYLYSVYETGNNEKMRQEAGAFLDNLEELLSVRGKAIGLKASLVNVAKMRMNSPAKEFNAMRKINQASRKQAQQDKQDKQTSQK